MTSLPLIGKMAVNGMEGSIMAQATHEKESDFSNLCQRILERCHQQRWYGPDIHLGKHGGHYFENGSLHSRELTHDPHTGFEFPKASEAQLQMTEEVMGFAHPPLLRALYLQVANGGFGPDTGLIGSLGGFCYWVRQDPRYKEMMMNDLVKEFGEAFCHKNYPFLFQTIDIDLEQFEQEHGDPRLIRLSEREWPTSFLHICDWQSEDAFYLHARSGRLYLVTVGYGEETLSGEKTFSRLHRQDGSFEDWWERWLDGTFQAQYYKA
ncbi:hypothetical protein [Tengunoibacter tsumagoiensis]|uniref:Knr4/Smi1-like domain-containing protein n=1 Tax=Tengunoibacter tsumagoiensis TaxID=2014871 RepID=A0A402A7J4_9CHLR|nr:hypothetical protein [Tengunoibacter tsumagoiensis]GCE15025.1 hypothetical protein KTT_48840 [Tengunoibacter tsumagoiensis]